MLGPRPAAKKSHSRSPGSPLAASRTSAPARPSGRLSRLPFRSSPTFDIHQPLHTPPETNLHLRPLYLAAPGIAAGVTSATATVAVRDLRVWPSRAIILLDISAFVTDSLTNAAIPKKRGRHVTPPVRTGIPTHPAPGMGEAAGRHHRRNDGDPRHLLRPGAPGAIPARAPPLAGADRAGQVRADSRRTGRIRVPGHQSPLHRQCAGAALLLLLRDGRLLPRSVNTGGCDRLHCHDHASRRAAGGA